MSNAGGLGSLPCAMLSADAMRSELAAIAAGTAKPFNVNFFCHTPPQPDSQREAAWRDAAAPVLRRARHRRQTTCLRPRAVLRSRTTPPTSLSEFKPPVVSFHFGLPAPDLLAARAQLGREGALVGDDRR